MDRRVARNFLITFVVLLLFIFLVVKIFGGHHKKATPVNPATPVVKPLPDYSDSLAEVSMTIDGHINGDDQHRAIKITVDQYSRKMDIIGGYSGNILQENTFANNQQAYDVFLHSLQNSGFTAKRKKPATTNEVGRCPLGERFIFELNDSGDVLSHLWSSSCGTGNLGGQSATLESLFKAQVTDYNKIISTAKVVL
jgi:hypothetical protein